MTTTPTASTTTGPLAGLTAGARARVGADSALLPATLTPFSTRLGLRFGLRATALRLDAAARAELHTHLELADQVHVVAKRPCDTDDDLDRKRHEIRRTGAKLPAGQTVFLEVDVRSTAVPLPRLELQPAPGAARLVLKVVAPAVPNALAGALLVLRDELGTVPHIYFSWSEGNPITNAARYVISGRGDTAVTTREILRRAEPARHRRPTVHVG